MDQIKIAEISHDSDFSLPLKHLKVFFDEIGKPIELHKVDFSEGFESEKNITRKIEIYDATHVHFEISQELLTHWPSAPAFVHQLMCFDYFLKSDGRLWPRLLLYENLRDLIVNRTKQHDIREAAYVISDGLISRILVSLMVHLGHKKVFLVSEDEKFLAQEVEHLRRVNIGVEITGLSTNLLTMQTTRASIMINTLPLQSHSQTLSDLVYFNFMQKDGLVIDINFQNLNSLLLDEASRADLKTIDPVLITAHYNFRLIQNLKMDLFCSLQNYYLSLKEFVQRQSSREI